MVCANRILVCQCLLGSAHKISTPGYLYHRTILHAYEPIVSVSTQRTYIHKALDMHGTVNEWGQVSESQPLGS